MDWFASEGWYWLCAGFFVVIAGVLVYLVFRQMKGWAEMWHPFNNIGLKNREIMIDYPQNWENLRREVLSRDGGKCTNCGGYFDLDVYHFIPLSEGGTNNLSNLYTLCTYCHNKLHNNNNAMKRWWIKYLVLIILLIFLCGGTYIYYIWLVENSGPFGGGETAVVIFANIIAIFGIIALGFILTDLINYFTTKKRK